MTNTVTVPLVDHDKASWGCLNFFNTKHQICGESYKLKDNQFSFLGGHRVRLLTIEGNVHWKIPADTKINITNVKTAAIPQRRQGRK